jgi:ATP-dependent DNA ligase
MDGNVRVYSRGTSVKTDEPVLKTQNFHHIIDELRHVPNGTVLDGEMIVDYKTALEAGFKGSRSHTVISVTGATPENARIWQEKHGYLHYVLFDCLAFDGFDITSWGYEKRYNLLEEVYRARNVEMIDHVELAFCYSAELLKRQLMDHVVANGGEGIILKDLRSPYLEGLRKKAWIKVKKEFEYDVIFMGTKPAAEVSTKVDGTVSATRIAGLAGSIRYGQYVDGTLRELGNVSGFNDAQRRLITENEEECVRNKQVFVVRAFGRETSGALYLPRFIRWREDKPAEECVWDKDHEE